jgi:hypothetical protein
MVTQKEDEDGACAESTPCEALQVHDKHRLLASTENLSV